VSPDLPAHRPVRNLRQLPSHASLYKDVSRSAALPPITGALPDALIVPASRPAAHLQLSIRLSASLGVPLVILCSKEAKAELVAVQAVRTRGARTVVIDVSQPWSHPAFVPRTSAEVFLKASANRGSDLSMKRNIGLLLARLHGWSKVVFVDDDITSLETIDVLRLASQLEKHPVAGMVIRAHPDNSVVCHARRLIGRWQDVFVSGAVLGVRCNDLPLSFFPDIYNEDWFFFAREAAARDIPSVGNARQAKYDPFATAERARGEEFGDLMAEGLYALFGLQSRRVSFDERLDRATPTFWSCFINARRKVINEAIGALCSSTNDRADSALSSLDVARRQLIDVIKPELCVNFMAAWRDDLADWQKFSNGINTVGSTSEAMEFLRLGTWLGPNLIPSRSTRKKRRTVLRVQ